MCLFHHPMVPSPANIRPPAPHSFSLMGRSGESINGEASATTFPARSRHLPLFLQSSAAVGSSDSRVHFLFLRPPPPTCRCLFVRPSARSEVSAVWFIGRFGLFSILLLFSAYQQPLCLYGSNPNQMESLQPEGRYSTHISDCRNIAELWMAPIFVV